MSPNTYFKLVRAFPLVHIRDASHLAEAQGVIDELLRRDLDEGAMAYLDALTDLVELYEDAHEPRPWATGAEAFRILVEAGGLTQAQVARAVGIPQSTISALINGARKFTRDHAVKLGQHYGIPPRVFLEV